MDIRFAKPELPQAGTVVLVLAHDLALGAWAEEVDRQSEGLVRRALETGSFSGKAEESLALVAPAKMKAQRILLLGLGEAAKLDRLAAEKAGGTLTTALNQAREENATVLVEAPSQSELTAARLASGLATGAQLRSYRFDRYRTRDKPEKKPSLARITLGLDDHGEANRLYETDSHQIAGVYLARDLISEPANVIYPETMAARCQALAEFGIEVEVLDRDQLEALGMGALLGVARGSSKPPKVVVLRYNGAGDSSAPVAFVGKGVTFDSGGLSIKPAAGMEDMKMDMGGAGVVTGLMRTLAGRKARVNAVAVLGLVENMPDADAYRPGDILTSMSGQTVEIINTDAEGRLVLADCLHYTQQRFQPSQIVDLATLTGAIMVALGLEIGGVFSNDDGFASELVAAGKQVDERVWPLPLDDSFDRELNTDAADMRNVTGQRYGSSSVAGQFLKRFVGDDVRWSHLDIAGVAWAKSDTALRPRGATGYGVRLLDRWVADYVESGSGGGN